MSSGKRRGGTSHTRVTWLRFGQLGAGVMVIDGYAPTVHLLAHDLNITVALASLHATGFGLGLIVASLLSSGIVRRIGRSSAIAFGLLGLSVGVCVYLLSPILAGTLAGIFIAGFFVTVVQSSAYADLALQFPNEKARILSEASAISQIAGVLSPAIIGVATGMVFGWRAGFAVAVFAAAAFAIIEFASQRRSKQGVFVPVHTEHAPHRGRLPMRVWIMWVSMVSALGVEFAMSLWVPTWLTTHLGIAEAAATISLSVMLIGIMAGRIVVARLAAMLSADKMLIIAAAICMLSFFAFWLSTSVPLSLVALFCMGLGIAGHYPLSLTKLIEGSLGLTDRATALGSLAVGAAVAAGPLLLGGLERTFGLQWAILLVPLLAVISVLLLAYRKATPADSA